MARKKSNRKVAESVVIATIGAVLGWYGFTAIVDLVPFVEGFNPWLKLIISVVGLTVLTNYSPSK